MSLLSYALIVTVLSLVSPQGSRASPSSLGKLQFMIDRSDRKLYVYRGSRLIRIHDVAVGMHGYATPLGSWAFHQVDINPDWTPPDSDWARRSPRDRSWMPAIRRRAASSSTRSTTSPDPIGSDGASMSTLI